MPTRLAVCNKSHYNNHNYNDKSHRMRNNNDKNDIAENNDTGNEVTKMRIILIVTKITTMILTRVIIYVNDNGNDDDDNNIDNMCLQKLDVCRASLLLPDRLDLSTTMLTIEVHMWKIVQWCSNNFATCEPQVLPHKILPSVAM